MNRLLPVFLVTLFFVSCSHKNNNSVSERNDSIVINNNQVKSDNDTALSAPVLKPDYYQSEYIFDRLPIDSMYAFVRNHRAQIDEKLYRYYGDYSGINDLDSVFEVMVACDFSPQANKRMLSFYVHVLFEIMKNEKIDGYVAEYESDICFELFSNYPGIFYQHVLEANKIIQEKLAENIALIFCMEDIDGNEMNSIFERQKKMLCSYEKTILLIENQVKYYRKKVCENN